MKSFWLGLLVFFIYAAFCLSIFYSLNESVNCGLGGNSITVNPDAIITDESIENSKLTVTQNEIVEENKISEYEKEILQTENAAQEVIEEQIEAAPIATPEVKKAVIPYKAMPFTVYGNDNKVLVQCNLYALIYKNRSKVKIPYGCINYGLEIKKILDQDEKAFLTITGYNAENENSGIGKQRAEYLKKLLLGIGIDHSRIKTNSSFQNIDFVNGIAKGGVIMKMTSENPLPMNTSETLNSNIPKIKTTKSKPSFPFSYKKFTSGYQGDYFYGNQIFTSYIYKVKTYLQENPDKKIHVYTHTDTVGNAIDNMDIAKANSLTAKRIIAQSGIPAFKIKSISMGEKPVDANGSSKCIIITVK